MILKSKPTNKNLLNQGHYVAKVSSVAGKPDDANPKKVVFGFKIDGYGQEVTKELPASLDDGTPLRADVETLLGRQLTRTEAENGYDPKSLAGTDCQVAVMHRSGSGGRPVPVVTLILPPATPVPEAAAN